MYISNLIIKAISIKESQLLLFSNFGSKVIRINYKDINKAYIKSNNIIRVYFSVSVVISISFLSSLLFWSIRISFFGLIFLICFGWYYIKYNSYYIVIKLNNKLEHKFFFSKNKKHQMIEKIKIIRGKI